MNASSILVIRLRELGDTILATPLLRQLKKIYPQARLDVLCQKANRVILKDSRYVDETIVLPRQASAREFLKLARSLRAKKYDLIIDAQGLPKTALMSRLIGAKKRTGFRDRGWRNRICYSHPIQRPPAEYMAMANLRLIQDDRVDFRDTALELEVSEKAEASAEKFKRKYFAGPVAAVFGVDRYRYRSWSPQKTAVIADRLAGLGFQPWLVYGPGQEADANRIASFMKCGSVCDYEMPTFDTLAALLSRCALCVGNDGGPMHAARAVGIPTITIYHHAAALSWAPIDDRQHRIVCTRGAVLSNFGGHFVTDALSLDEIPIEAVWQTVMQVVSQCVSLRTTSIAA